VRSALYEGTVRHRRLGGPITDEFRQRIFMTYIDLDELPELFDGRLLWSARRPAPAWFRRADHLGDPRVALEESVRALVFQRTARRPQGPIGLLTNLRYMGHCFNPVSFYYCFEPGGQRLSAAIAHVTNTPWGESHSYVVDATATADHDSSAVASASFEKRLHVSPLMGMHQRYELRLSEPRERLSVHITATATAPDETLPGARPLFDATLSLARREMSSAQMARVLARYPLLTVSIIARIYAHALRLRLRGAAYHANPARGALPT
jgi:uncharacterized protein